MNVHFYIDNEEETPIMNMYDVPVEPFKVGDKISLDVDDVYPKQLENFRDENKQKAILLDNQNLIDLFHLNTIQIKRMGRYARFDLLNEAKITIEYHCHLIPNVK